MTEIAIVSSRRGILEALVEKGSQGAARALELADNPNRFLSTVQIGITLVGILAGAVGGARLVQTLSPQIARLPGTGPYAEEISFAVVIGLITYFSLVLGELVPKRLALRYPEPIAVAMAGGTAMDEIDGAQSWTSPGGPPGTAAPSCTSPVRSPKVRCACVRTASGRSPTVSSALSPPRVLLRGESA